MDANDPTSHPGIGVIYFHGAASVRDLGPDEATAQNSGVVVIRHVRPGYDDTSPRSGASLRDVASDALDEALAMGLKSIVAVGWSGGGPYALAAGSLGRRELCGVGLVASWAPMDPPHRDLPGVVRVFMRIGQRFPRSVLRLALAVVGRRNPGHVDDIHRVARPWGFTVADVTSRVPVAAWHSAHDTEVPIGPWEKTSDLSLRRTVDVDHVPSTETWSDVLAWARSAAAPPAELPA